MTIPRRLSALLRRCGDDARGVTVIEFAIVAPVMLLLLIGIYDMGHTAYLTSVLHGAVQQAARSDALEGADTAKADAFVAGIVKTVAPGAVMLPPKRTSYYDFADVARPEAWNDKNGNGVCDKSETYTDENKNGKWDADVGNSSNGKANDVVIYTVTIQYKPVFIVPAVFGVTTGTGVRTISASAVHKNQPFALQEKYGSAAGTCP